MAGGAHHKLLGQHLQTPTLLADSDHIRFDVEENHLQRKNMMRRKEKGVSQTPHLLFPVLQEDSVYPFQSKATGKHLAMASGLVRLEVMRNSWLIGRKGRQHLASYYLDFYKGTLKFDKLVSEGEFIGLAYQGKDIVFRFIIEYSSLMGFGPG